MPEKNEAEPTSAPERRYGTILITGKRPLTVGHTPVSGLLR